MGTTCFARDSIGCGAGAARAFQRRRDPETLIFQFVDIYFWPKRMSRGARDQFRAALLRVADAAGF